MMIACSAFAEASTAVQGKNESNSTADLAVPLQRTINYDVNAYFSDGSRPIKSLPIEYGHRSKDNLECAKSMMTRGANQTHEYLTESSSEIINVYDQDPEFSVSAIKSARVEGNTIYVSLYEVAYYRQYSTTVVETYRKTHYEARPGTAVTVQVLTLGLSALFAPKMSALQLFGCNDIEITDRSPDWEKKKFTGYYMSGAVALDQKIAVSGLGSKTIEISFDKSQSNFGDRVAKIDMIDAITASPKEELTNLSINCLTCTPLNDTDVRTLGVLGTSTRISTSFADIKQTFIEAETRRVEEERLETLRIAAEKSTREKQERLELEKLRREKQKQLQRKAEQDKNDRLFKL